MLITLYAFSRALRQSVLVSVFGGVSTCRYSPTCGELLVKALGSRDLKGIILAIKQFFTCF